MTKKKEYAIYNQSKGKMKEGLKNVTAFSKNVNVNLMDFLSFQNWPCYY